MKSHQTSYLSTGNGNNNIYQLPTIPTGIFSKVFDQPNTLRNRLIKKQKMSCLFRNYWRHVLLVSIVLGSLTVMLSQQPFGQDLRYHDFADRRLFSGILNFFDVISNLPFVFVGVVGVRSCIQNRLGDIRVAWITLFTGVALVSIGSAYYHLEPNNETLVWDRLPMTIGFMSLFVALLSEYVSVRLCKALLVPALLLGFSSVLYWHWFDDLRFYAWIQMIPLLTIPVVVVLFRSRYSGQWLLLGALGCYVLAKISELYDREVYALTHSLLSGHSLKHILAALGGFALLWMVKNRRFLD
jgi:hypothetical protein